MYLANCESIPHPDGQLCRQAGQLGPLHHQAGHLDGYNPHKKDHNVHNDPVEAELEEAINRPSGQQVGLGHQHEDQLHAGPLDPAGELAAYQRDGGEEGDAEEVAEEQQQRDDDHGVEEVAAVVRKGPAAGQSKAPIFLHNRCQQFFSDQLQLNGQIVLEYLYV